MLARRVHTHTATMDPAAAVPIAIASLAQADERGPVAGHAPPDLAQSRPRRSDARSLALTILAVLATLFALSWAQAFLVPLLLGVVISYALSPLVGWLQAARIPRALSSAIVLAGVVATFVLSAYALRGQVQTVAEQLPEAATRFATELAQLRLGQAGSLEKLQSAASTVEKATAQAAGGNPAPRQPATHVIVDSPKFSLSTFLWAGSMGMLGATSQALAVMFLVYFLLLGGDTFKRKLVRLTGPTLSRRRITVHVLDAINGSLQKTMLMLLTTNVLVALLCWFAFHWLGLDNAGAWAVAAGLLHIVPYLGPGVTAAVTGMAAFMQFDSFAMAGLVAGASLAIATAVGTFVTTWMTGRIARMNSAAVFVSLLFWGWLWGIWGMLLSIPIMVILKVVAENVEPLQPIADLLDE